MLAERFNNGLASWGWSKLSAAVKNVASARSGAVAGDIVGREVKSAASSVMSPFNVIPAVHVVCAEVRMLQRDINNAMDQRRNGQINREEFIKITVKRTAESVGSLGGVAVAFAIPVTRNSIGITLGSVIGHGFGSLAGRWLCVAVDSRPVAT